MMRALRRLIPLLLLLASWVAAAEGLAETGPASDAPKSPGVESPSRQGPSDAKPRPEVRPKRIAYYEGGPYSWYPKVLKSATAALARMGRMEAVDFSAFKDAEDSEALWRKLAEATKGDPLEFVADAWWSAGWDDAKRAENRRQALARLGKGTDIDLVVAMGTWAGQDLAVANHTVPVLVMSASDPVQAKIVASTTDSGLDHVHAQVDPTKTRRQVRLFHELVGFKRLGVVYEDTVVGRSYAGLAEIEAAAAERKFGLAKCHAVLDIGAEEAANNLLACHDELIRRGVDAVYLTVNNGMIPHRMAELLEPFQRKRIPTFSQLGSEEVRLGVLFSMAQAEARYVGEFHAQAIAKVLDGAKPRSLPMLFEEPPKIALNLQTAETIGFDPPVLILMAADEIFRTTEVVKPPETK